AGQASSHEAAPHVLPPPSLPRLDRSNTGGRDALPFQHTRFHRGVEHLSATFGAHQQAAAAITLLEQRVTILVSLPVVTSSEIRGFADPVRADLAAPLDGGP